MPLHRFEKGEDPAGALKSAVEYLEKLGEAVVRWDDPPPGGEWVILTRPPKPRPPWQERAA